MNWDLHVKHFGHYLKIERSLSENSLAAYLHDITMLRQFVGLRDPQCSPQKVTTALLHDFLEYVHNLGMSAHSQARILSGIKAFYRYMLHEGLMEEDPTALIEGPRLGRKLPTRWPTMRLRSCWGPSICLRPKVGVTAPCWRCCTARGCA